MLPPAAADDRLFVPARSTPAAPAAAGGPPLPRDQYEKLVEAVAKKAGVDHRLALSVAEVESNFNPNSVSEKGARGLMQLMPDTARLHGVQNIDDPLENVRGGVAELQRLSKLANGDLKRVMRRYVASPAAQDKDTDFYVEKVMKVYRKRAGLPEAQPGEDTDGRIPVEPKLGPAKSPLEDIATGAVEMFDPTTRQGRRNLFVGAGTAAATPFVVPTAPVTIPAALGSAAIGAGVAGLFGATEELGEQVADQSRRRPAQPGGAPPPPAFNPWGVASAGAQEAAYDVGGHAALAPFRWGGRWLFGPSLAGKAKRGFAAQREADIDKIRQEADALTFKKRQDRFDFAEENQSARAASDVKLGGIRSDRDLALGQAERRVQALLDTATEARRMAAADAEEAAIQGTARAGAEGEAEERALAEQYQRAFGQSPSEPSAGRAVIETLEGPGQAAHDILGKAVTVAAETGPERDLTFLKNEGRAMVAREILPPERTFPRVAPKPPKGKAAPAAPGLINTGILDPTTGKPIMRPAPPPRPPRATGSGLNPRLRMKITDEELAGIARHPAMPIIDRILNAPDKVPFPQLALWYRQLSSAVDWDNPSAGIIEGSRQHLLGLMRRELAAHEPYNLAASAYEQSILKMKEGYAKEIAQTGRIEPARVIQMIRPDDPTMTQRLMGMLSEHGPEAARGVREAWLHRHVLSGGVEGLGKRLDALDATPEFRQALFGGDASSPEVFRRLRDIAETWEQTGAESVGRVTQAKTAGRQGVETANREGAKNIAAVRQAGDTELTALTERFSAALDAQKQATKATRNQRATEVRTERKRIDDRLQTLGINEREVRKISDTEALAILRADLPLKTAVNALFAGIAPLTSFRGAMGLAKILAGPRSGELLRLSAARPELSKFLVDWLANPNARITYQVAKRLVGTTIGTVVEGPGMAAWKKQRVAPPASGRPRVFIKEPPPAPPAPTKR